MLGLCFQFSNDDRDAEDDASNVATVDPQYDYRSKNLL